MTDAEVIAAIRRTHLQANIAEAERVGVASWLHARVDPGGTVFGPGPYLTVPVLINGEWITVRVYPPARLRRRLARAWGR